MNTETASNSPSLLVRKSVHVLAAPARAFEVFTRQMTRWWPLGTHHIGKAEAAEAVIEPFVGGRWYERGVDGSECDWGRVLAYEPPGRLVLAWMISADWQFSASLLTEVEVRFVPDGAGTRVELEHRKLEAYGPRAAELQGVLGGQGGWTNLLAAFAAALAQPEA